MSSTTNTIWSCDWCGLERAHYNAELPHRWHRQELSLTGRVVDLCPECFDVYKTYCGDLEAVAHRFWWDRVRFIARGEKPRRVVVPAAVICDACAYKHRVVSGVDSFRCACDCHGQAPSYRSE